MNRKYLRATEGNIYTDGEIYGKEILLAEGVDASAFYEITVAEYEKIQNEANADEGV